MNGHKIGLVETLTLGLGFHGYAVSRATLFHGLRRFKKLRCFKFHDHLVET